MILDSTTWAPAGSPYSHEWHAIDQGPACHHPERKMMCKDTTNGKHLLHLGATKLSISAKLLQKMLACFHIFEKKTSQQKKWKNTKCCPCLFKSIQYSDQAFGRSLEMLWGFAVSKHGYHPTKTVGSCPISKNLIQLRPTCLSAKTQTHLSSAIHSIPLGSQDRRVVQPIVIEIPFYPWNYVKLSNLQLRSIPPKICFRNPLLPPICFPFKFHSIPPMLPHGNRGRTLPIPPHPRFSANGETSERWQLFRGKDLQKVTAESLRTYIYDVCILWYDMYMYIYKSTKMKMIMSHCQAFCCFISSWGVAACLLILCSKNHILSSAWTIDIHLLALCWHCNNVYSHEQDWHG